MKTCPSTSIASSNSEVCSSTESNNSKKRGQHGKYTPEQKAMIGKRAAEHGDLCASQTALYWWWPRTTQLSLRN